GRPYLPAVPFETDPVPWYFLILVIGSASLWAMNRLRDSRLGRAWMAIREDETAADCTGVNPISTKLLAFALGASFSGFAGSVYAAKLQAITPGAFEFQVSIMLLCMVVLGGAGSLKGAIPRWLRDRTQRVGSATTPMLEVRGLDKRFGGVVALNEVDLIVPRGSIIGLIGPNGAGKTTFFNVVTGLIRPDGGRLTFEGTPLNGLRPNAIVARGVARTFQSIRLFPQMTVLDNVL